MNKRIKPNIEKLTERFGNKAKEIAQEIECMSGSDIDLLEEKNSFVIELDDTFFTKWVITKDEVIIEELKTWYGFN